MTTEKVKRVQELRRSNAATPIPSKKKYKRKEKHKQEAYLKTYCDLVAPFFKSICIALHKYAGHPAVGRVSIKDTVIFLTKFRADLICKCQSNLIVLIYPLRKVNS